MTEQFVNERENSADIVEVIEKEKNGAAINSENFVDVVPLDMAVIRETSPVGGPVADVEPVDQSIVNMTLMGETIHYDAPKEETIAIEPMKETPTPFKAPMGEVFTREIPTGVNAGSLAALLNREESEHLRTRWNEIQGQFVDEPRSAVQQADTLVSEVVEKITRIFANEHNTLEAQWKRGSDVSTEDLRQALQHYRSFFNRLVV